MYIIKFKLPKIGVEGMEGGGEGVREGHSQPNVNANRPPSY